jgi:hypothetical protein
MDNRKLIWVLAGLLLVVVAGFGYTLTRGYDERKEEVRAEAPGARKGPGQAACASNATYARLKEVAFEEAVRVRAADPANLDMLAAHSVVRMENPVVMSRDEELNVTVCSGRFILELPPGAEAAFGGQRRLSADIEYAAQAAADGSGLVYELRGAEPVIQKLAAFDLRGQRYQKPATQPGDVELAEAPPAPEVPSAPEPPVKAAPPAAAPAPPAPRQPPEPRAAPQPKAAPKAAPRPAEPTATRSAGAARPSFNCRVARSRSEQMVCSSSRLAAKDRAMSSLFYSALADADRRTRSELRRTRDRFLAYRERCGSEACVAEAYDGRMDEIRDIMAGAN